MSEMRNIRNLNNEKFKRRVKELVPDEQLDVAYNSPSSRELFRMIVAFHLMSVEAKQSESADRQIEYSLETIMPDGKAVQTNYFIKASTYPLEMKTKDFKDE